MRLEWLIDLLAIIENESLNRAAEKRFISQPAFSRRIRVIEEYVGVELLDRSRKPARVKPRVADQKQKILELVNELQELLQSFQRKDDESLNSLVIASQHAITSAVAPALIKKVSDSSDFNIRLRSANRDDCYALLMTNKADLLLIYCTPDEQLSKQEQFLEHCMLGSDSFIPVCASTDVSRVESDLNAGEISIVAYPSEVFFGGIMNRQIYPIILQHSLIRKNTETALSLAALQCALVGVGVAWVPHKLAKTDLVNGRLADLSGRLPAVKLSVVAVRLNGSKTAAENNFWNILTAAKACWPMPSEGLSE